MLSYNKEETKNCANHHINIVGKSLHIMRRTIICLFI